ncbi:MAG TPA: GAF domain-containing sensor histidine kinase [Ktedonobacteraceae bacterium]|nr:GAF domain-containing sensor histidine kinase [Ktedonobacteraceae bacterium]
MIGTQTRQKLSTTEKIAALSKVGVRLLTALDEIHLMHFIAKTARDVTGATFAALSLRPVHEEGQVRMSSERDLFHMVAVVGISPEQEVFLRHMLLAREGLLASLFRQGVPVLMDNVPTLVPSEVSSSSDPGDAIRLPAQTAAIPDIAVEDRRSAGIPPEHPLLRSFLEVPLLTSQGEVRGGLLLGHSEPGHFTVEDKDLLVSLATQAAMALEHARLSQVARRQAVMVERIFAGLSDGVILVDRRRNILYENAASRLVREQFASMPGGKQAIEALLYTPAQRALRQEVVKDILVHLEDEHGDVREYTVSASLLPLSLGSMGSLSSAPGARRAQGGEPGVVVLWHDVTERRIREAERQARAEMEDRLATLQLILDELPSGVFLVYGHNARLLLANRAMTTIWEATWPQGQPMDEFLAQNGVGLLDMHEQPLIFEQLATLRAVRHGETVRQVQSIIRQPNGTTLSVLVNAIPLDAHRLKLTFFQPGGFSMEEPPYVALVNYQDVTILREADQLKDKFIGTAAHELRHPVAVLRGYVQMLLRQNKRGKWPKLLDRQEEALQSIDQSTAQLVELSEDLLDVTRLQGGGVQLHCEPVDLVVLVQRMVQQVQVTTDRHMLTLVTTVPSLVVNADPVRIEQVLSNLLSNAIRYSPEGGMVEITISEVVDTHGACVSIRDSGIGIPEKDQARIFGQFARASNAESYGIGGTGLGLYLCREVIERHHGRIWFESKEGQGTAFSVALPGVYAAPDPASA